MSINSRLKHFIYLSIAIPFLYISPILSLTPPQKLIAEAWRIVDQGYVDRTFNKQDWFQVRQKLIKQNYQTMNEAYETIRYMLKSLNDPYTRFLTPNQYKSLTASTTGELAGIGIELFPDKINGFVVITTTIEEGPAYKSGIQSGDCILQVNGMDTTYMSPDEVAARIRGSPGSFVEVLVKSGHDEYKNGGNKQEKIVEIKRENLKIKSVKGKVLDGHVGYLKVKQFNSTTANDARIVIEELKKKGVEKYILDLRNNPGGYFPAGVDVARLFLPQGAPIVFVFDKNGISDEIDNVSDPIVAQEPMVVLVNKATASASEILAGALKDNKRAQIIGEKTFGKGVVQTVSGLSDGSGLAVTIARYETPGHFDINKVGISPDVVFTCEPNAEPLKCLPTSAL